MSRSRHAMGGFFLRLDCGIAGCWLNNDVAAKRDAEERTCLTMRLMKRTIPIPIADSINRRSPCTEPFGTEGIWCYVHHPAAMVKEIVVDALVIQGIYNPPEANNAGNSKDNYKYVHAQTHTGLRFVFTAACVPAPRGAFGSPPASVGFRKGRRVGCRCLPQSSPACPRVRASRSGTA